MLNEFHLVHRIVKLDNNHQSVSNQAFMHANCFATMDINAPTFNLLSPMSVAETHERLFYLILDSHLQQLQELNDAEKSFLQIVLLHKMQQGFYAHQCNLMIERSGAIINKMIHHQWTHLLLFLAPSQHTRVFEFAKRCGIDQGIWEFAFIVGAARTRTIQALSRTPNCTIYFPTIHETLDLGIDLLVLTDAQVGYAMSIHSGNQSMGLYAEQVFMRPVESNDTSKKRQRIFDGVVKFNTKNNREFHACRILVGKPNGRPYDLTLYEGDISTLRRFISRIQPPTINQSVA